jgi:hypothetical protein
MLREMSSVQWLQWRAFMQLRPFHFDQERADVRAAMIAAAIWNVQIAKGKGKKQLSIKDFLGMKWGDYSAAELFAVPEIDERDEWDSLRAYAESIGRSE